VLHSFTGSAQLAHEYTRRGHYVSFSGSITDPNARKVLDAVRAVPDEYLLIETDSPDQTPHDRRPATNEPANVRLVAEAVAHLRETDVQVIARTTFDNAVRVFDMQGMVA
jgi:TatD DNase family protein